MAKVIVPLGFLLKFIPEKPGMVMGMFWEVGEEDSQFLCDECSLKELKAMEPPLKKIDEGWYKIQMELYDRGIHAATFHPRTSVRCEKCGLIVPVNLGQS
jgi:hypothetical protein